MIKQRYDHKPLFEVDKREGQLPLEDFFRVPESAGYHLSPDGTHLSLYKPYKDRMNIFVRDMATGQEQQITFETARSVAGSFWANNERILYMKDKAGDENYKLYGVNLDGSNSMAYTDFPNVRTQILDDLEQIDDYVLVALNKRNAEVFDPYRLDVNTGELSLLVENPGNVQEWMTDHDGKLRVAVAIVDGVNQQILYRTSEDDEFKPVLTTNFKETVSFADFTPDNKLVYATTNIGRDKIALVLMDPNTCKELEVLYQNEDYDLSNISYSEARKKLLGAFCVGHKGVIRHYFDEEEKQIRARLYPRFNHDDFGVSDWDKSERTRIVYAGGDRTYGTYYLYKVDSDELTKISDLAPWIKQEEMASMIPVKYTSRDGLSIEAYLTLPKGETLETAKNLSTVINPHGGPWARDTWGFSPEVQFLANRGYAVFQMNFRASTGFGRKFLEAGYKQWGQTMQNDITDGVEWLKLKGIADPKHIAIYGGSYGGYATLAGITFTPDLYCCAVDYVGVSNLFSFMKTVPPYWKPMLEMMYEMVGDPEKDKEMMEKYSPVFHVNQIKVPLFIAQGQNDPRVNKNESDQMVEALRKKGVEVEYMVKEDEGHGFHNQENRFDFYRAMESFFAKYL